MRLGISSYTYVWAIGVPGYSRPAVPMTVFDLLAKASASGVQVLQVADNLPLDALSQDEFASFHQQATERGIALEVGTRGVAGPHLKRYLDIAVRIQSPIVRVVVDTAHDQPSPLELVRELAAVMPDFERAGITVALENHDRFTAESLRRIVQDVGSRRIGICFDTANSIGCLESPERVLDVLEPYVVNLHIKDFQILRAPHNKGFVVEGRPAGRGQLAIPPLLDRIGQRNGTLSAILSKLWPSPEPTIEATVAKEDCWARESIAYLRQFIPD